MIDISEGSFKDAPYTYDWSEGNNHGRKEVRECCHRRLVVEEAKRIDPTLEVVIR